MRDTGEHGQCVARPLLVALSSEDLGTALADMGDGELRQLFQVLGLRVPASRLRSAKHSLVSARLRSLPPSAAHVAALYLTAAGMNPLLDVVSGARGQADDTLLRQGIFRLRELWPYPLMKLLVTVMTEVAMINADESAAVMALLDEGGFDPPPPVAGPPDPLVASAVVPPPSPRPSARLSPGPSPPPPTATAGTAALPWLVLQAAGAGTALDHLLVSSLLAAEGPSSTGTDLVAPAIAEILSVRPTEPGSWFLVGMAVGRGAAPPVEPSTPPGEDLGYYRFLGTLTVLTRTEPAGTGSRLFDLLDNERRAVERLVASPEGSLLAGSVLGVLIEHDPRWAAALLSLTPLPFAGWLRVMAALRRRAAELVDGTDMVTAELLLRAADEALSSWAVASEEAADVLGDDMQAEAAQLCLLRVSCRRARRDFVGAARLAAALPDKQLTSAGRVAADGERALIAAEVADVTELRFPRSGRERRSMLVRVERARRHVEQVLEADGDNLVARLLSGMHAICVDDDGAAARDLGLAEAALVGVAGAEALLAGVRFHRALSQLRLLEPGTDESAYRRLTSAMSEGYDPIPAWLVAAAEALDAHESPLVAEAISLAASVAPADTAVTAMVCAHARRGTPAAVELAQRLAADQARSLSSRFELLEAALEGTGAGELRSLVEPLVGEIDDVVVRACDPALDGRWAALLGQHEGVRLLLDPLQADLVRVDVLRRVGRVEEARELAGRVFYRVAAGAVAGVDTGDVFDLVAELGAGDEELAPLRPLVRGQGRLDEETPPLLDRDVRILFVGGNETQERYQAPIDAMLAERYGGRAVVEWFTPGWGANWMKAFARIESCYEVADAVVVMTFVRTLFGRRIRKTAGEAGLPWIACTGHGRAALERAIERAITVVAGE